MAQVTVRFLDNPDGSVNVSLSFEPELDLRGGGDATPAQSRALEMLQAMQHHPDAIDEEE